MHTSLAKLDHRPWPRPSRPWVMRQSWLDLLFVHYEIPLAVARRLVPEPLKIDTFEGKTWVGIVPFRMSGVMLRLLPDLPWISAFPECNVRLYVEYDGKPGVYFLSLDATNPLAVRAARAFFHLPYKHARISVSRQGEQLKYHSLRTEKDDASELRIQYGPTSGTYFSQPGTLEHFLTERYCLYASSKRNLYRADVHHLPWPLQRAEAVIERNTLCDQYGIELGDAAPLLHYSGGVDTVAWAPVRVCGLAGERLVRMHNLVEEIETQHRNVLT